MHNRSNGNIHLQFQVQEYLQKEFGDVSVRSVYFLKGRVSAKEEVVTFRNLRPVLATETALKATFSSPWKSSGPSAAPCEILRLKSTPLVRQAR